MFLEGVPSQRVNWSTRCTRISRLGGRLAIWWRMACMSSMSCSTKTRLMHSHLIICGRQATPATSKPKAIKHGSQPRHSLTTNPPIRPSKSSRINWRTRSLTRKTISPSNCKRSMSLSGISMVHKTWHRVRKTPMHSSRLLPRKSLARENQVHQWAANSWILSWLGSRMVMCLI